MKIFILNAKHKALFIKLFVVLFWLAVWQIMSIVIAQQILLVSPVLVIKAMFNMLQTLSFWKSIMFSFSNILMGFIFATFTGILLAALSYKSVWIKELLYPLIITIKSAPIASFILLALIWFNSKNLSIFISFLMTMPIIYTNVLTGIIHTDAKILEMCQVFNVSTTKKILYVYTPYVMPYFISAATLGIGLAWKAGIAAELIGLPENSIGENLYNAKIFLETDQLLAWTFVIIIVSIVFEKTILYVIKRIQPKGDHNGYRD